MRILPAFGLVILACSADNRRSQVAARDTSPSSSGSASQAAASAPGGGVSGRRQRSNGPDPIVLRVPRAGGPVRAYLYPNLDSVVWTSRQPAPAVSRVLAFDDGDGSLAFIDAKGAPGRLDLRLGTVSVPARPKLTGLASADGYAIYGITATGEVQRLIPTGTWSFKPPTKAREVVPLPDGTVLVLSDHDSGTVVWRIHPPDGRVTDSARVASGRLTFASPAGDRLYVVEGRAIGGIRSRDGAAIPPARFDGSVRAVAPTPSGDRLFVATDSSSSLTVYDRYAERVAGTIALPRPAAELRMDPLGRFLLARAPTGDSVTVVSVGTGTVVGVVRSAWSADVPQVAPDGAIELAAGNDAVFVEGATLRPRLTITDGMKDIWQVVPWNGFRPRAAGLDVPVTFDQPADTLDSLAVPPDSTAPGAAGAAPAPAGAPPGALPQVAAPAPATVPPAGTAPGVTPAAAGTGKFNVSFATLAAEDRARALAGEIRVGGQEARVVTSLRGSATIYRVILGPFTTREEAERMGRESRRAYWVYEDVPE